VIDPTIFPIASKFSAAVVTVKPGALREIHWHTTSDEWNFFIGGSARIGVYAAQGNARTFDYVGPLSPFKQLVCSTGKG
jgi:oxalate decarboxylase/phosphoglucose isomerase-like protein (cupin superfamily)